MNSINILKKLHNDEKLLGQYIVAKKLRKLKALDVTDSYSIRNYLLPKLNRVYLHAHTIYDAVFNDSRDGTSAYATVGDCFYFSFAIILAMEPSDLLVNGNLAPECSVGYEHQWVEFCYFGKWYVIDNVLNKFQDKWFVLDTELMKVYDREHYYSVFSPTINPKKSNEVLMRDDFAVKHAELLRNPEWSYNDTLFFYYKGEQIEECKKALYENIEIDENGNIISYNDPNKQKSQSK